MFLIDPTNIRPQNKLKCCKLHKRRNKVKLTVGVAQLRIRPEIVHVVRLRVGLGRIRIVLVRIGTARIVRLGIGLRIEHTPAFLALAFHCNLLRFRGNNLVLRVDFLTSCIGFSSRKDTLPIYLNIAQNTQIGYFAFSINNARLTRTNLPVCRF